MTRDLSRQTTVVIACYSEDRWNYLTSAIDGVLPQVADPANIIVVADHNPLLYEKLVGTYPTIRILTNRFEKGASGARNTGGFAALTPLIAFLDDDACPNAHWLARLVAPFSDEDVVGTGGSVIPLWESGEPRWFPMEFGWAVGASYTGMATTTSPIRNVWSENMAIRRDAFSLVKGFRLGFGKVGAMSRPEDTDLCIRVGNISQRAKWMYVPDAVVQHRVPPDRSTFRFFLRRCYLEGRGKIEMARLLGADRDLSSEQIYLRHTLPAAIARGVVDATFEGQPTELLRVGAITAGAASSALGAAAALLRGASQEPERNAVPSAP